jgi:hypothetical protein
VLFTLLLSGGFGSWLTRRIRVERFAQIASRRLLVLPVVLFATGWVTLPAVDYFTQQTLTIRVGIAVALLSPAGAVMGMAFPLGMRQAMAHAHEISPWLFGINGAMSVCASVLAAVISLIYGISTTFWFGVAAYVVALLAFLLTSHRQQLRHS